MTCLACVLWMGSWLVRLQRCQSDLAKVLGTLDTEDLNAVAEFPKPIVLAVELSRQFSMWVSALEICLYFEGFLSILTKGD